MKIICTFFTFCQIRKMSMFSPIRNKHKLIDIPIKAKFWWRFQSCHFSSVACIRRFKQRAPVESFFVIKLKLDSFVFGFQNEKFDFYQLNFEIWRKKILRKWRKIILIHYVSIHIQSFVDLLLLNIDKSSNRLVRMRQT